MMEKKKLGFAFCGSFCTFRAAIDQLSELVKTYDVTPIMSYHASELDTRFGRALDFIEEIEQLCGHQVLKTIQDTEPIGPKKMFDLLVVAPCTGNTLAKLAHSITDTPVTMAVKSHLRTLRPVLLAVATNDALGGSGKNLGLILNTRHFYVVPMQQDDPFGKPNSLVARFSLLGEAAEAALGGRQLEPLFF